MCDPMFGYFDGRLELRRNVDLPAARSIGGTIAITTA